MSISRAKHWPEINLARIYIDICPHGSFNKTKVPQSLGSPLPQSSPYKKSKALSSTTRQFVAFIYNVTECCIIESLHACQIWKHCRPNPPSLSRIGAININMMKQQGYQTLLNIKIRLAHLGEIQQMVITNKWESSSKRSGTFKTPQQVPWHWRHSNRNGRLPQVFRHNDYSGLQALCK